MPSNYIGSIGQIDQIQSDEHVAIKIDMAHDLEMTQENVEQIFKRHH